MVGYKGGMGKGYHSCLLKKIILGNILVILDQNLSFSIDLHEKNWTTDTFNSIASHPQSATQNVSFYTPQTLLSWVSSPGWVVKAQGCVWRHSKRGNKEKGWRADHPVSRCMSLIWPCVSFTESCRINLTASFLFLYACIWKKIRS